MGSKKNIIVVFAGALAFALAMLPFYSCKGQDDNLIITSGAKAKRLIPTTIFPQVHSDLHGIVSEFVRVMYQDKKGNVWFGTNANGIVRYNGTLLEKIARKKGGGLAVRGIVEDGDGNVWFGTSSGVIKYDGKSFATFAIADSGTANEHWANASKNEVWAIEIDNNGSLWIGSVGGAYKFNGSTFEPFIVPKPKIDSPKPMLSDKRIGDIVADRKGNIWFATDGYGISKYNGTTFELYTQDNGLPDNNVADIFEDSQGNIWIGTFYGGVSKYDGNSFVNFTKEGVIEGMETYNFCEDNDGNVWFAAEGYGVYRYDGKKFTQFTTEDGLATNGVQSIFNDKKGQLWFGTWSGISLYDGTIFTNASDKEPWAK